MENKIQSSERVIIKWLLRGGLVISVLCMVVGLLTTDLQVRPLQLDSVANSDMFLAAGILLLALTPILRVLTLAYLWSRERDWKFVLTAVAVLFTLGLSLLLGLL